VDFDQLNTFLEIVRLKSFSKAAQTCYRTQPAISAQIRQMEHELGTRLFDRFGSRISLTTAGGIFAGYARTILDTRRQAFDEVRELEKNPRGELTIAANEATCLKVLPQVFSNFKAKFPAVQLKVIRSYASKTIQSVLDNSIDFGITQLPVQDKKLEVVQVYSDEIRLIVPADHPLASKSSVGAEDISDYPLIVPKEGRTRIRITEYMDEFEDELNISMELESSEMIKQFVISGLGVGFMAVTHARDEVAEGELVAIRLEPLPMIRTIGLVYRKDKAFARAGLGFIEVMAEFAKSPDTASAARYPLKQSKAS